MRLPQAVKRCRDVVVSNFMLLVSVFLRLAFQLCKSAKL